MIRVQQEDFDPGQELATLTAGNHKVGGFTEGMTHGEEFPDFDEFDFHGFFDR